MKPSEHSRSAAATAKWSRKRATSSIQLFEPATGKTCAEQGIGHRSCEPCARPEAVRRPGAKRRFRSATAGRGGRNTQFGGAIVAPDTIARARAAHVDPRHLLATHDSYTLFDRPGDLVRTGPTGTNVNDIRAIQTGAGAERIS